MVEVASLLLHIVSKSIEATHTFSMTAAHFLRVCLLATNIPPPFFRKALQEFFENLEATFRAC